jgi:transcriptional regulator with XRE-family HTH domain
MRLAKKKMRGVPELGARIKRFMAAADLDASELSARASISTSYMSRILNGENVNPTIDFVKRIAAALGVTETELVRNGDLIPAGAFGSGVGLGTTLPPSRTPQQQAETDSNRDPNIEFFAELKQIVSEVQLTPEKRILAERLILESARTVCEVLQKNRISRGGEIWPF